MKIFKAYIIEIGQGQIKSYEQFSIKANSRKVAWDNAILIAFPHLLSSGKMVVLDEVTE
jgi:hypothetical protein